MKILGLDVGTKRIGVARADSNIKISIAHCTINVDGSEIEQIAKLSRVYDTKYFVVGLPRNSKGEETEQSKYSRDFASKLKSHIKDAKIFFQDESLTSVEAEKHLKNSKKNYTKGDIDSEAAAIILQDFLDNFPNNIKSDQKKKSTKKRKKTVEKKHKKLFLTFLMSVLILFIFGAISVFLYNGSLQAVNQNANMINTKTIIIQNGATSKEVATLLKNEQLIQNELTFRIFLALNNKSSALKAGEFQVNDTMSIEEIVAILTDGKAGTNTFRLTFLPGATIKDFTNVLIENGYSQEEINEALSAKYENEILLSRPESASLEGYIFGETYEFIKNSSVKDIVKTILSEFQKQIEQNNIKQGLDNQGLTLYQGIILASIVQKESKTQDMPEVASVFLNRIKNNMSLGSDVTVSYALDLLDPNRETYTNNYDALNIDSCYNTRKNAGLPCGPISNPGIEALRSVAYPANTTYLYFLTGDDGLMYYSNTEAGHSRNITEHCQVLCKTSL